MLFNAYFLIFSFHLHFYQPYAFDFYVNLYKQLGHKSYYLARATTPFFFIDHYLTSV